MKISTLHNRKPQSALRENTYESGGIYENIMANQPIIIAQCSANINLETNELQNINMPKT